MDQYFTIKIYSVLALDEDWLVNLCFEFGAAGVSENLQFVQTHDNYEPQTIEKNLKDLVVYFETDPPADLLRALKEKLSLDQIEVSGHENKDWMEEWKKGFESFALVDDLWVVPSWLVPPSEAKEYIRIDPGMAFGTGTHETTQVVSELLCKFGSLKSKTVLDVGTGTGILAMACSLWDAERVVATEIDELARNVARENVNQNGLQEKVNVLEIQIEEIEKDFDIVIANIIDGVLIQLESQLNRCTRRGGQLFLSGILEERRAYFFEKFQVNKNWKLVSESQKGEWLGLHLEKK